VSAWRDIATAPKDAVIMLWDAETSTVNVGQWNNAFSAPWHAVVLGEDANWSDLGDTQPIFRATHWMPLPDPPLASGVDGGKVDE
jgi:hypothetical protein